MLLVVPLLTGLVVQLLLGLPLQAVLHTVLTSQLLNLQVSIRPMEMLFLLLVNVVTL